MIRITTIKPAEKNWVLWGDLKTGEAAICCLDQPHYIYLKVVDSREGALVFDIEGKKILHLSQDNPCTEARVYRVEVDIHFDLSSAGEYR